VVQSSQLRLHAPAACSRAGLATTPHCPTQARSRPLRRVLGSTTLRAKWLSRYHLARRVACVHVRDSGIPQLYQLGMSRFWAGWFCLSGTGRDAIFRRKSGGPRLVLWLRHGANILGVAGSSPADPRQPPQAASLGGYFMLCSGRRLSTVPSLASFSTSTGGYAPRGELPERLCRCP